jgi:hypothetical protein
LIIVQVVTFITLFAKLITIVLALFVVVKLAIGAFADVEFARIRIILVESVVASLALVGTVFSTVISFDRISVVALAHFFLASIDEFVVAHVTSVTDVFVVLRAVIGDVAVVAIADVFLAIFALQVITVDASAAHVFLVVLARVGTHVTVGADASVLNTHAVL